MPDLDDTSGPAPDTVVRPAVRQRVVLALVRPYTPNVGVLQTAADLAQQLGCGLLVVGTLDRLAIDCADGIEIAGPMLEAAHGELFASCVEQLWDRELRWGVSVTWGRVAAEVTQLTRRVEAVRVVCGGSRPATRMRRWRRRLTGRIEHLLRDHPLVVA